MIRGNAWLRVGACLTTLATTVVVLALPSVKAQEPTKTDQSPPSKAAQNAGQVESIENPTV